MMINYYSSLVLYGIPCNYESVGKIMSTYNQRYTEVHLSKGYTHTILVLPFSGG